MKDKERTQTEIDQLMEDANAAADNLSGIINLNVIRGVCEQIMGSLTPDMLQVTNYALIAAKTRGAAMATMQNKIDFVMDHVRGTVMENPYHQIITRSPEKILFPDPIFNPVNEEQKEWFNKNYCIVGFPPWMFTVNNTQAQDKYAIDFTEEEVETVMKISIHNSMHRQGTLLNMFCGIEAKKTLDISQKMLSITEDVASSFKAGLFYFGAVPARFTQRNKNQHMDNMGYATVRPDQIGADINFELVMLEKTPRYISIYTWQHDPAVIKAILTFSRRKGDMMTARMHSKTWKYEDITDFAVQYNL